MANVSNVNFDMKKLDYFINKEIDEVAFNKAKNPSSTNLLQYEFIKNLTWGDSRLISSCPNSYNDIQSPLFKTSSPLSLYEFNSRILPNDAILNESLNSPSNKFLPQPKMKITSQNINELSYLGQSIDNSLQPLQCSYPLFEMMPNKSFNPQNDIYTTARNPDLNISSHSNNSMRSLLNASFILSGSSNEYNSAYSSFPMSNSLYNMSSPNLFSQSGHGFLGSSVKRQVYQVSEEFSPVILFDVEKKKTLMPGNTDNIWNKLDISSDTLVTWIERLRKYLVQTIFVRVVNEIDQINLMLVSSRRGDIQVGETSLATLKLLCDSRHSQIFDRIKEIFPFIELHPNQRYLIDRIRTLNFGCMSSFKWDAEGSSDILKMDKNNPSDTTILMHFLCTYLDARLPQSCQILDGKTFSRQHFISFGEKIKVEDYSNSVAFIEENLDPPHFNVVSNGQIYLMKRGPTNVFQSILFFFYCIKISHQGMLRRISIGQNGLNLLWIFNDN